MKNKYPFFRYKPGNSKIHNLNSKIKITWFLLSLLICLIINDYISALLFGTIILFVAVETKIYIWAYINNLSIIWPLYVLGFVISFVITFNILFSILIVLKLLFIVILFLIITFTTSLSEIAWGFECLFEPLKKIHIPVTKIALRISLALKFISTVFEQSKEIRKSMAYRGVSYKESKIKTFNKMFLPTITLSYKLSRRMMGAMRIRFYGSLKRRTNYHENKTTKLDKVLVWLNVIFIYITIWLGWIK